MVSEGLALWASCRGPRFYRAGTMGSDVAGDRHDVTMVAIVTSEVAGGGLCPERCFKFEPLGIPLRIK